MIGWTLLGLAGSVGLGLILVRLVVRAWGRFLDEYADELDDRYEGRS